MAITAGQDILASDFVSASSGASDSGKVAKLDSDGLTNPRFIRNGFGGDASDGTVTISVDTDIDASSAAYVVKNYNDLTIDVTKTLGLTNPHDNGTFLHIKVAGDFVWNGKIDLNGCGALGGQTNSASGKVGTGALNIDANWTINRANEWLHGEVNISQGGQGGGPGSAATQYAKYAGGAGGGGGYTAGSTGGSQFASNSYGVWGWGGDGGQKTAGVDGQYCESLLGTRFILVACGGGGGAGGSAHGSNTGGTGGRGGGAVLIEVLGDVTIGASAEIDLEGTDGGAASGSESYGAGGGGGGGGGIGKLIYKGALTDSGLTKTVAATSGGSAVGGAGAGAAGGTGHFDLIENITII